MHEIKRTYKHYNRECDIEKTYENGTYVKSPHDLLCREDKYGYLILSSYSAGDWWYVKFCPFCGVQCEEPLNEKFERRG